MNIPKYDDCFHPILVALNQLGATKGRDLEKPLIAHFGLSDEEALAEYTSGNGLIFLDRISWALSHLRMVGLINRPRRAHYEITKAGKGFLNKDRAAIKQYVKDNYPANNTKTDATTPTPNKEDHITESSASPVDSLNTAFESIRQRVCNEILDTILTKTPSEFEKLVVKLMVKMGYGGSLKNAGQVTQASNDGGIDGMIKEDVLGLGTIYLQAKRYGRVNGVGREEIQKFVGALAVASSSKGVFITTSYFSKGAVEYVKHVSNQSAVVLIDGAQLAAYIYDYGLGVSTEQTLEVKRLDADFWDDMIDDASR